MTSRLALAAILTLAGLAPATAEASGAGSCARLAKPNGTVIDVTPGQASALPEIVRDAPAGATIRLADGTYPIEGGDYGDRLVFRNRGVTLRSASGDAQRVVLDGAYGQGALVHVFANDVTIAEVTLTRAQDHLVHVYPDDAGPDVRGLELYRLRLIDSGEQFVKVNSNSARSAWVDQGTVACSEFVMTATGRQNIERAFGCYTGGIDAHSGRGWRVRDNVFEGIYCEDGELAEHAVHFWNGARDTIVENNVIANCARAIGFGLVPSGDRRAYPDDPYPGVGYVGHYDGVIRNNAVLADIFQYDTGIELAQARGGRVLHNTIAETPRATRSFSSIDYRFANTSVEVRNNLVRRITGRDGGQAQLGNNVEGFALGWLVGPTGLDFHLRPGATGAIDRGAPVAAAGLDIDGRRHDRGPPDIGADELGAEPAAGRMSVRLRGVRRVRGRYVMRRGRVFRVVGKVAPYVSGQVATIRLRYRGRRVRRVRARIRRVPGGRGRFVARFRARRAGRLTIRASHKRTDVLGAFSARPVRVRVIDPR